LRVVLRFHGSAGGEANGGEQQRDRQQDLFHVFLSFEIFWPIFKKPSVIAEGAEKTFALYRTVSRKNRTRTGIDTKIHGSFSQWKAQLFPAAPCRPGGHDFKRIRLNF